MSASVNERVSRRREALRRAGLRPVQIWVPDTRRPGFEDECRRQSCLASRSDTADEALDDFLDDSVGTVDGWTV